MNETLQALLDRKSTRVFETQPIAEADKALILRAAMAAPSAGNQQLYTILHITDPSLQAQLAITCDHQPFIAQARMVLLFCADCQKWYDAYLDAGCQPRAPGVGDLMLAVVDAAVAAQNAVTAAQSLGIGSCYIGDVMERCEEHRTMLQLPPYVFPAILLVLGYPTLSQRERQKPERCACTHIVHTNVYQRMDGEALRDMLAYKAGAKPYADWIAAFCARKYNAAFSEEMTRSVGEYLKAFTTHDPISR